MGDLEVYRVSVGGVEVIGGCGEGDSPAEASCRKFGRTLEGFVRSDKQMKD
jgi:hypothetical protein